jgi:hypothetical protein
VRRTNVEAAVADIRLSGKHVVTFLGFSGSGYEDSDKLHEAIGVVLASLDVETTLVNAGGTSEGIGIVYSIAKSRGFPTIGIVSSLAHTEHAVLSSDADKIYMIADDLWGGFKSDGTLAPTSMAMVEVSDEMVAIGGDEIARDELSVAMSQNKPVRYIPAEINHLAAKAKAEKNGQPEPNEFLGAASKLFLPRSGGEYRNAEVREPN